MISAPPTLAHAPCPPTAFASLPVETAEDHDGPWQPNWPAGTERRVLGRDAASGGSLTLLRFPPGYDRDEEAALHAAGRPQRFEYHTCHEEIISLEGDYAFGVPELYRFDAPSYLNHPPHWLHPARQRSEDGVLLLVRNSHPVDFGFCDVPSGWDGREGYLDDSGVTASASAAVTTVALDHLDLEPVDEHGRRLEGVQGHLLWHDAVTGWRTWLLEATAGATLATGGDLSADAGGDEWFVLNGGVRFEAPGSTVVLDRFGYRCDPDRFPAGGSVATAVGAVRLLRWVRGGHLSTLRGAAGP